MKYLLSLFTFVTFSISVFAQERIGIGTNNPQAQLHTTGEVIFGGVSNDNNQTKLVVQNGVGLLGWRDAGTLTNYYWCLNGNGNTSSNNFLGTSDNLPLIIKTNNMQRVKINTSAGNSNLMGGVIDVNVDSLKVNGAGLAIYRKGNVNRWGSSMEFHLNNSIGEKKFYARINGGIQSNTAGSENGFISFEVATNGQLGVHTEQAKMIITSEGYVGIGEYYPTAQLHTTETVRFEGITNDNNLTKVLVQNNSGQLYWRDIATIGSGGSSTNAWNITGNAGTNPLNAFLGTSDDNPIVIKTDNEPRVQINTSSVNNNIQGGVVDITTDSLKLNGCGLGLYRKGNVNGWGSSVEFQLNNSLGQKKFYARINGGIESNTAGSENGVISFEVATNGQLGVNTQQIKMVINSQGYVGYGTLSPTAQIHTTDIVRHQNLPTGTGNYLLIDANGYLYRSETAPMEKPSPASISDDSEIRSEITILKAEIENLKKQLNIISKK